MPTHEGDYWEAESQGRNRKDNEKGSSHYWHMQAFLGHLTMELRGIGLYNTGVKSGYSNSTSLDHKTKTGTPLTLLSHVRK